jgi:hypothetical protein
LVKMRIMITSKTTLKKIKRRVNTLLFFLN